MAQFGRPDLRDYVRLRTPSNNPLTQVLMFTGRMDDPNTLARLEKGMSEFGRTLLSDSAFVIVRDDANMTILEKRDEGLLSRIHGRAPHRGEPESDGSSGIGSAFCDEDRLNSAESSGTIKRGGEDKSPFAAFLHPLFA
jgi:hypothetical protein